MSVFCFCFCCLLWITLFFQDTGSASDFIQVPPNPQYVLKGGTARFVWTYSVGDRVTKFKSFSPIWFFNSQSLVIGRDNGFIGWKFQTSNITCPQRLLKPTVRVSRENQATLVIKDVIIADSGFYGCTLALLKGNDITNTTALFVTETPRFTVKPNTVTAVTEHKDLSISCKAVGPPSPRITWRSQITNALIVQGIGSAVLRISKVNRSQNGKTYLCLANNNPNENPILTMTTVVVRYPPEFTRSPHNTTINQGQNIILHCQATANPPSSISWKRENNVAIKSGFTVFGNGTLMIPNAKRSNSGVYICRAMNIFNLQSHTSTSNAYVSVKFPPGPPQVTATTIKSTSATISWIKPLYSGNTPITGYKLSIDSGLTINTQYIVRFYAQNDAGYGKAASVQFITKNEGPPGQPIVVIKFINQTSVTLTWSKPEQHGGAITEYTIYKKVYCDSWTQVGQISGTPLTYTVENLQPGKTYRIIVTATNEFGESVKDDSKAKIVVIPDVTTKLPNSGRTTASTAKQPGAMIAVGVCVCLLVISLIFNILSVVYFYRIKKRSKKTTEPTYDNVEMAAAAASHENMDPASLPSAEYELVKQTNATPSTVNSTYDIPGNQQTSQDHYQQLYTETMQHDPTVQYEPLRTQHVTADQRNNTYEPLRNIPTEYQSLQKYSNA